MRREEKREKRKERREKREEKRRGYIREEKREEDIYMRGGRSDHPIRRQHPMPIRIGRKKS